MTAKRSLTVRIFAATLFAWLSAVTIEPLGLHSCPMHSGIGGTASHSMGAMHGMAHHATEMPARQSHSNQCSCPGDCAGTAASIGCIPNGIALPKFAERRIAPADQAPAVAAGRYTPRLLPFANGPPSNS